jgi:hypothetical protein
MGHKTNHTTCSADHIKLGTEYIKGGYITVGEVIPTALGLAIYMDVSRATPYNWAKQEHNPFADQMDYIIDRVQAIQGVKAINGGLSGELNAAMAKLVACNHGFSEKQSHELAGPNGGPIKTASQVEWVIQPIRPINETDS